MELTVTEFVEEYNEAPWDLEELAEFIIGNVENGSLVRSAEIYLSPKGQFERMLDDIGFELG